MFENVIPLTLIALAGTMTPGPNNIMLTASGSAFGFRRTVPHMMGIIFGFPAMVAAIGLGLGEIFIRYHVLHLLLKYGGAAYLLYLAWRIARAGSPDSGDAGGRPLRFFEAVAFQWVNIKAWMMAVTTISAFTTVGGFLYYGELAVIVGVYLAAAVPSSLTWCMAGVGIRRLVSSPGTARVINLVLAAAVAASVVLLLTDVVHAAPA